VGIAACSDSAPSLAPLDAGAMILAFGDSLTYGTGADREASYPAVLEELTGLPVINAGVPGEVTAQGLSRLPGLLKRHRPGLVILCHGGNDMLRRESAEAIYSNLEAMVDLVRAHGAEVLLVGVPQPRLLFLRPAEIYDRLANDRHLVYLRDALPQLESDAGMKSDPIHLNGEGYRRLAVAIQELMRTAGAVSQEGYK
jgi:acyl-CoA thioesterase-1